MFFSWLVPVQSKVTCNCDLFHAVRVCQSENDQITKGLVFTALHCMQHGFSDERLSVCLSVKHVNCDKTKAPSEKVQL